MPIIPSLYNPPFLFKSGHFSTIYSGMIRKVIGLTQERERLELGDGDFMDLDWSYADTPTSELVILLHGLEGNAQRPYITGSAKQLNVNGIDACAVNYRGCSGETNRLFRSYHSGATEDLEAVINHILKLNKYTRIYLKGFSLGGNMTLKYLGEGRLLPKEIKGAIAISAPVNLHSSLIELLKPKNIMYAQRFKKHLIEKLRAKQLLFPTMISDTDIAKINTLKDFDDIYTSKAHGFKNAIDYYQKSSSLQYIPAIKTPTLIINAKNDSFLGEQCYPSREAELNKSVQFEQPLYGGHVGFYDQKNITYTEKRALKFIEEL
ncbi:alpha/beta fold hydrolase [Arenibacter sp. BSSL-BM3]|uniref:Alpha/beta fold hydrolase n=1 Tax=Arenibacter arenosicollis TaxID=2762274 RepID=A0ABR7QHJ5_9FLAO|nr:alpha/beta fold hydrolase [Arenibacter arenosicollis]MBC8766668.1 alpha/beta fold hydrolase [Arenibacter arenosicollis]